MELADHQKVVAKYASVVVDHDLIQKEDDPVRLWLRLSKVRRKEPFCTCVQKQEEDKNLRSILESNDSDTDDDSYHLSSVKSNPKCRRYVTVKVGNHPVHFQVDSGAHVNVMDELTFSRIKSRVRLVKCNTRLYAYGSKTPLRLLGKFTAT